MKKWLIIHPILFAIFPILFFYSHNIEQCYFSETFLPSGIILGFTLLLVVLLGLLLRNSEKAGILVSICLLLFFSYGHVYDVIASWRIAPYFIGRHMHLMLTWGMLFTCGVYILIRTRRDLYALTRILNIVAFSLVTFSLINIGFYEFKTRGVKSDTQRSMPYMETNTVDVGKAAMLRDIYYIILDGYASSSTLTEFYGYDNQEFIDYLNKKGFYIASKGLTNYATTFLSLASSLNMEYLDYLTDIIGAESKDRTIPNQMIRDSKVMNFLKSKGYKFIHFGSGGGPTGTNKYADLDIQCKKWFLGWDEFTMVFMQTTMLRPFEKYLVESGIRGRLLCTFSKLAEMHRIEGSKFIFAHILCPHAPYVFGANGEEVSEIKLKMSGDVWKQKENYLNQLIFVSKKVEMLVDKILLKSGFSPIIILQADHGTASTFCCTDNGHCPERPTETNLKERMRIFNAYYLPPDGSDLLYDSITPVNTFRLIFDLYFNTNYKILIDQSYFSTYEHPYKFIKVTDKVKYN